MRSSLRTRRAAAAVCAAGAVFLLGACASPAKPGAAAVVGTERVTDQQVADRTAEVLTALGGKLPDGVTEAELNRRVISNDIQAYLIDEAATREGITVTPGQVAQLRAAAVERAGGLDKLGVTVAQQFSFPPSSLDAFLTTQLQVTALIEKLGKGDQNAGNAAAATYLGALSTEVGTEVSPRFGTWSAKNIGVGPPEDDLSSPPGKATTLPGLVPPSPAP